MGKGTCKFSNSDLKRKIFGHGINSVFQTVTIYSDVRIKAHNDFIETLHDYGYFGLFLLIAFIAMLFKEWYYQFREHTEQLAIYSFSMIVTIFLQLSAISLLSQQLLIIWLCIGE